MATATDQNLGIKREHHIQLCEQREPGRDVTNMPEKTRTRVPPKQNCQFRTPVDVDQLEAWVKDGKLRPLRESLDQLEALEIADLETHFQGFDPVIIAVAEKHEDVAIYLIEKGFKYNRQYNRPNKKCDQWCYSRHLEEKCPCVYDSLDLAEDRQLTRVVTLIQEIQRGLRRPGHSVGQAALHRSSQTKRLEASSKVSMTSAKTTQTTGHKSSSILGSDVKSLSVCSSVVSKNGDTSIHQSVIYSAADVYACVNEGVNVNAKNFDGDTALHIAVRLGNIEVAKALCSCGANLIARNKLSQTPLDLSQGDMRVLLGSYKRGMVSALMKGEHAAMQRICRLWPNPDAVIKHGQTALQLAQTQAEDGPRHQACYNLLQETKQSMRLVHAVLSEDVNKLRSILSGSGWNINVRYKDKLGETPLSVAVQRRNTEIVKTLLETGKCHINIRVREHSQTDSTVPLMFKSLERDCPDEIWRILENHSEPSQLTDRDAMGDTGLLRAIRNGKPPSFISQMLIASSGHSLTLRNAEGLHARELALKLEKSDIVNTIDQFICDHPKYFVINLAVAFYGENHLDIRNADGEYLLALTKAYGTEADCKALTNYTHVEDQAIQLFRAAEKGDVRQVAKKNTANYQDKNGYTALTKAIVFNQTSTAEALLTSRPGLASMTDNCGRNSLHYAFALPDAESAVFIRLLERCAKDKDHSADKDGRLPAECRMSRDTPDVQHMLRDARELDTHGQRRSSRQT